MVRVLVPLSLVLIVFAAPACAADPRAALERAMQGKAVPALAVLEIRNFKVAGEWVRGPRRMDRPGQPAKLGDRWHLGSDTKPMTATLVARLVEEGKLSWRTRLDQLLPELAASMRDEYRDVTLVDLLSHRSGLPENVDESDSAYFRSFYADERPLPAQRLAYVSRALTQAPVGQKRADKHYSNTGLILAAVLAERAAGRSYEQLMADKVFRPLRMASALFTQAKDGEPVGHVDGRPATQPFDPNPAMFNPAGQARMSLDDWAKFCIDQMQGAHGRGKLLKTETYRFMQTAQSGNLGLGWGVPKVVLGRQGPALTHSGSDGNWNAIVVLLPETGNGLLVAANAAESMGGDKASSEVAHELLPDLAPPAPAS